MTRPRARYSRTLHLHGIYEYVAGAAFVAAPWVFDYDHDAARTLSLVVGIVLLVMAFGSHLPTSLVKALPTAGHIALDFTIAVVCVVAPFLFGFRHEDLPTWWFVVAGVVQLVLTFATDDYPRDEHVVGSLAEGTSTHIERGEHTSADE
ncbi:MAG: hypothetical protein JWN72_1390 [Thermoleophilia bacterium]|nr:hypothetical protein [Thermoleophilia bacterium]